MMNQEKFILVSLEDEKAKNIAEIISNSTSRKILDYLSTKDEVSETEISKELNLPLSTVHYNLQKLKKNSLVETKHFSYSNKGKKIEFYRVVKKFIIIAPKYSQVNLIKNLLPLFLISAVIGGLIQLFTNINKNTVNLMQKATVYTSELDASPSIEIYPNNYYGIWFLLGAWFILIVYMIIQSIKKSN